MVAAKREIQWADDGKEDGLLKTTAMIAMTNTFKKPVNMGSRRNGLLTLN